MRQLGYYAKDKDGNLFRFEWSSEDEFSIALKGGAMQTQDPRDYEIVEIGELDADTELDNTPNALTVEEFHVFRDKVWSELCTRGQFQDDDDGAYRDLDSILGKILSVDWS